MLPLRFMIFESRHKTQQHAFKTSNNSAFPEKFEILASIYNNKDPCVPNQKIFIFENISNLESLKQTHEFMQI